MTIASYVDLIAALQPRVFYNKFINTGGAAGTHQYTSMWPGTGDPGAGASGGSLSGQIRESQSAQVGGMLSLYQGSTSPDMLRTYLVHWSHNTGSDQQNFGTRISAATFLCDRLWDSGAITINASPSGGTQTVNSVSWPERDLDNSSAGRGVLIAIEIQFAFGSGTAGQFWVDYTNSDGVARTGAAAGVGSSNTIVANAATIGTMSWLSLQAGDRGAQSIQNVYTNGVWPSGTVRLCALRPIALIETPNVQSQQGMDAIQLAMPQIPRGCVPFLINVMIGNNTRTAMSGSVQWAHG
jgi:hypothetical protein